MVAKLRRVYNIADHTLLSCCVGFQKNVNVMGILFREYEQKAAPPISKGVTVRLAKAANEQKIWEMIETLDNPGWAIKIDPSLRTRLGLNSNVCAFSPFVPVI